MSLIKQVFLVLLFVKVLPVCFYPYTFDDFLYSNEEIAIAVIFILFIATIERYYGQIFFDAFMEKARYLRALHESFTKEKYEVLKKEKKDLGGFEQITQALFLQKNPFFSEFLPVGLTKTKSNELDRQDGSEVHQLLQSPKIKKIKLNIPDMILEEELAECNGNELPNSLNHSPDLVKKFYSI